MTIDHKIRDKKLQYDINREEAKYQHYHLEKLTNMNFYIGEEILPLDQRRVIEQAKFSHSPLGKAFEKQTKMIEDQGEKQIEALEEYGKQLIKSSGEKDSLEILKQKEIFDELVNETKFETNKSNEEIDFNNLTYYYTGKTAPKYIFRIKGSLIVYNDIKNGQISLQKEEKFKENFDQS